MHRIIIQGGDTDFKGLLSNKIHRTGLITGEKGDKVMKLNKFTSLIIFIVCLGLMAEKPIFAQEANNINLSYKVLESYSDDQTLITVVRLRAENTHSTPIYDVVAKKAYTNNVSIDKDEIYLGDIDAAQSIVSSDSFTITINIESSDQEPPQKEIVWRVEYTDINEEHIVEDVTLR